MTRAWTTRGTVFSVDDGSRQWSVTPSAEPRVEHSVLILGLRPDTRHQLVVTATDAAGNVGTAAPATIVTESLPDNFPPVRGVGQRSGTVGARSDALRPDAVA